MAVDSPSGGTASSGLGGGGPKFPRFSHGKLGPVRWYHWNALFAAVEALWRDRGETAKRRHTKLRKSPFVAVVPTREDLGTYPLASRLAWDEEFITDPSGDAPVPAVPSVPPRSSQPPGQAEYTLPGFILAPPHGTMFPVNDQQGRRKYVWFPATQVYVVNLTAWSGSNGTYTATSVDASIVRTLVIPTDRWPGVTYPTPATRGLLIIRDGNIGNTELWANERPQLNPCPNPAGAGAGSGGTASSLTIQ